LAAGWPFLAFAAKAFAQRVHRIGFFGVAIPQTLPLRANRVIE
jgi:hypothetical protein